MTETDATPTFTLTSPEVRDRLTEALELDLVGPWPGHEFAEEMLHQRHYPSNWYLTGFLIPTQSKMEHRSDPDEEAEHDEVVGESGLPGEDTDDRRPAKRSFFPSSVGLSFLVDPAAEGIDVLVEWGDYVHEELQEEGKQKPTPIWQRRPRKKVVSVPLAEGETPSRSLEIPDTGGLRLHVVSRVVEGKSLDGALPPGTRSVSIFLVNERTPDPDDPDLQIVFQPRLTVTGSIPFIPRPNLRGLSSEEVDERVADLHYADAPELAAGHGISAEWSLIDGECRELRTAWIPSAEVERTDTVPIPQVELGMDALGNLADGAAVRDRLMPLVAEYRAWIDGQAALLVGMSTARRETAEFLLQRARKAADRIEAGIESLVADEDALDAFRVSNRAVSRALKKRLKIDDPQWRAFQLAFLLLNLSGMVDPKDDHRETVDLLYFPTGGGKTEAYLGLAAFSMVLRRIRNRGLTGAGVSVLMRYTLRLLTLDQMGRAAGLVCALELEREKNEERYGEWPFEVGLWVGQSATPNKMGFKGEKSQNSARVRVRHFKKNPKGYPSPIPVENCPWCGERLKPDAFDLHPNADKPLELKIHCTDFECEFSGERQLPIVAVDEVIYRRLPAFLIATVDKLASLPWEGTTGLILGGASRADGHGFYGAATTGDGARLEAPLLPPDLVIQDELHLISGPLGTMTGLYETAIEALSTRTVDGRVIRPKVVASTATLRRAESQIEGLFGRPSTHVFPPAGPNRRDSFFARTKSAAETPARRYLGVAAQGRTPKAAQRRTWLALMAAAQNAYVDAHSETKAAEYLPGNPADPYMTALGYFNSLRALGGARRILEEEIQSTIKKYGARQRVDQARRIFRDRANWNEVVELTSRVRTADVAAAKRRLEVDFSESRTRVDAAIATNMISVGLDISRLGLMVLFGQPKNHSEYIQATSRVGRDAKRPGLVVTVLNIHKPRDRSHYERFRHYHETFYRSVEVASVTPFSPRALDRGLGGAVITLARHLRPELTPAFGVEQIEAVRGELEPELIRIFTERGKTQHFADADEQKRTLQALGSRIADLLDSWTHVVKEYGALGERVQYWEYEDRRTPKPMFLLRDMLDSSVEGEPHHEKFRTNRSLRDVEPEIGIWIKKLGKGTTGGA